MFSSLSTWLNNYGMEGFLFRRSQGTMCWVLDKKVGLIEFCFANNTVDNLHALEVKVWSCGLSRTKNHFRLEGETSGLYNFILTACDWRLSNIENPEQQHFGSTWIFLTPWMCLNEQYSITHLTWNFIFLILAWRVSQCSMHIAKSCHVDHAVYK